MKEDPSRGLHCKKATDLRPGDMLGFRSALVLAVKHRMSGTVTVYWLTVDGSFTVGGEDMIKVEADPCPGQMEFMIIRGCKSQ